MHYRCGCSWLYFLLFGRRELILSRISQRSVRAGKVAAAVWGGNARYVQTAGTGTYMVFLRPAVVEST